MLVDVHQDELDQPDLQHRLGPVLDKSRQPAAGLAAEQGRPVGIAILQVIGDRRRIMHDPAVIDNDRHAPVIGLRQFVLFGEPPRQGLDREPLMGQRHLGAPTEWAEAALRLDTGEIVHRDRHGGSSTGQTRRHYGASLPRTTTAADRFNASGECRRSGRRPRFCRPAAAIKLPQRQYMQQDRARYRKGRDQDGRISAELRVGDARHNQLQRPR